MNAAMPWDRIIVGDDPAAACRLTGYWHIHGGHRRIGLLFTWINKPHVAGASVMPDVPHANTQSPPLMITEKMSDALAAPGDV